VRNYFVYYTNTILSSSGCSSLSPTRTLLEIGQDCKQVYFKITALRHSSKHLKTH